MCAAAVEGEPASTAAPFWTKRCATYYSLSRRSIGICTRCNTFYAGDPIAASATAHSQTLKTIKEHGAVTCGVSQAALGFSARSANREWVGFDVDFCRALSAAIFNDVSKVKLSPYRRATAFCRRATLTFYVAAKRETTLPCKPAQ